MNFEKKGFHGVLQGPNHPLKNWHPLTENPLLEFRHLKLVEIPITTVLFLIKTWLSHSLTHSLTLTHLLKLHQLILEIYQVVYLLYLWNYVNSHISVNYISHMIYIKTKSSHWELFWKKGILKSVFTEEIHFLVKLQGLDLQLKWAPSKVFLKYFDHRFPWLLFRTHIFQNSFFLKYL